jgi:secreted PhoX family phosphatase
VIDPARPTLADLIEARLSRRTALKGAALAAGTALLSGCGGRPEQTVKAEAPTAPTSRPTGEPPPGPGRSSPFAEVDKSITGTHRVAAGYTAAVLVRWGDPVLSGAPTFDPEQQTAAAQARQFGYNNDYVAFLPLPLGSDSSDRGLLWVNHEYTNPELMFPGLVPADKTGDDPVSWRTLTSQAQVEVELAAHGGSIMEVERVDGAWRVVADSTYNRRINGGDTEMVITGPAAGHPRMQTPDDPSGRKVIGMLGNCAGGKTPWGTVLTAEENFNSYFSGSAKGASDAEIANLARYGITDESRYRWGRFFERMNTDVQPTEPNRFGWMVEVDPYDPSFVPRKRTALGRFKHEAAALAVNPDGTVTAYSGDDEKFEYLYRFVSRGTFDPNDRSKNMDLLDDGVLSVAQFKADGTVRWLPLVHGQGPLTAENGFADQGEVLIETRRAADLVGATPMDRPEDVEIHPASGRVYVALTNNSKRGTDGKPGPDAANPRAENMWGQLLELEVPAGEGGVFDHSADVNRWALPLVAGDPAKHEGTVYADGVSEHGWLACPDNLAVDAKGRLWISTDQASDQALNGSPDGMYLCEFDEQDGVRRARTFFFYATPRDAEMCGPEFTPDGTTLFVAVQHPAEGSRYDAPSCRFPDDDPTMPPRPSVVAITRDDGGAIGG